MTATPQNINNAQLQAILANEPDTLVLDVRTLEEYVQFGHIPQACLIPIDQLPQQLQTLDPNQKTVVICQHGVRSWHSALFLLQSGFQNVLNHESGMASWDGPVSNDFPPDFC